MKQESPMPRGLHSQKKGSPSVGVRPGVSVRVIACATRAAALVDGSSAQGGTGPDLGESGPAVRDPAVALPDA